jgi:hypothetical protein
MSDDPLPDLTRLVDLLHPKEFRGHVAAAQKAAWIEWRGRSQYPGLAMRFSLNRTPNDYGFSSRSRRGSKYSSRGNRTTPYYVNSGSFKRAVMQRRPKSAYGDASVTTRFTIFGGVLNMLGAPMQRGWQSTVTAQKVETVQRPAHFRSVNGRPVRVRSYSQRKVTNTYEGGLSPRTYADEWNFRPDEVQWIASRTDTILRERLARIGYKNGSLKLKYRRRAEEQEAANGI